MRHVDDTDRAHLDTPGNGGRRGRLERAVLAREDGVIVSHKLRATIDQAQREIGFAAARRPFDQHRAASDRDAGGVERSEEHTSELQSLMRISYAVFCLKKKKKKTCTKTN